MLQTITVDIINEKALGLLMDLEKMEMIRLHREFEEGTKLKVHRRNYKGAMTQQSKYEIETQLNELRSAWE